MSTTSQVVLKAFLENCDPEKREALRSFLPPSVAEVLSHLYLPHQDILQGLKKEETLLDSFHPSWFEPFLRTLSMRDLAYFLSAFSEPRQEQLCAELGFSSPLEPVSTTARTYLRSHLMQEIKKDRLPLLPLECLPDTPFNALFLLTYRQKLKLIDLLSMYDLAAERKTVIEKTKLAGIIQSLTDEERTLLNRLSKLKDHLKFKTMNLNQWDGDTEHLRTLLRQRGINRLSKATFGLEPSFQWYLCHQLDMTSGTLYKKLHTSLENPEALSGLQEQVLTLVELFIDQHPTREGES